MAFPALLWTACESPWPILPKLRPDVCNLQTTTARSSG